MSFRSSNQACRAPTPKSGVVHRYKLSFRSLYKFKIMVTWGCFLIKIYISTVKQTEILLKEI